MHIARRSPAGGCRGDSFMYSILSYTYNMYTAEFASGALFAVGLFSAGVYSPAVIKSQFNFSSNVMITTMMGASAASA